MEAPRMNPSRRIIPKILIQWNEAKQRYLAITTVGFISTRLVGSPLSQAKIFESNGCDELAIIRIGGGDSERDFQALIEEVSDAIYTPLAIGGSIHSAEQAVELTATGADKVIISSTETWSGLGLAITDRLGAQAVIAAVDYSEQSMTMHHDSSLGLRTFIDAIPALGVGEVMLNSIERDGSRSGYDTHTISMASDVLEIPIIAGTGAGSGIDVAEAITAGADAAAVGTLFAFTDQNPMQMRAHVLNAGHHVRMNR